MKFKSQFHGDVNECEALDSQCQANAECKSVVTTQNALTMMVLTTVNAYRHSIWLKVYVSTMMNVQTRATAVTKVGQSTQMKSRSTLWNGSAILLNTK